MYLNTPEKPDPGSELCTRADVIIGTALAMVPICVIFGTVRKYGQRLEGRTRLKEEQDAKKKGDEQERVSGEVWNDGLREMSLEEWGGEQVRNHVLRKRSSEERVEEQHGVHSRVLQEQKRQRLSTWVWVRV
jgi:hypothetical protein